MPRAEWGWIDLSQYRNDDHHRWYTYSTSSSTTSYNWPVMWTTNETTGGAIGNYWGTTNYTINWRQARDDDVLPVDQAVREVQAAAREIERQQRHGGEQRAAARTAATDRAEELLVSMLSEDQRQSWRLNGHFEVIGSHGTVYRLHRGVSGNVRWYRPDGSPGGVLCAHPDMAESWLPTPDVLLSQLLALTTDEPAFLRVANVHQGSRPVLR